MTKTGSVTNDKPTGEADGKQAKIPAPAIKAME